MEMEDFFWEFGMLYVIFYVYVLYSGRGFE